MKALSLIQPWATLIIIGAKKIETRGWRGLPKYRGPLIIHASKSRDGFPVDNPLMREAIYQAGLDPEHLPTGALVGSVNLVDAYHFTQPEATVPEPERSFGNFAPGRIGLKLSTPRMFYRAIPFSGQLNIFDVDLEEPRYIDTPTKCRRCSDCEGCDHHWLESCPDPEEDIEQLGSAERMMLSQGCLAGYVCKHCDAWRIDIEDES